MSYTTSVCVLVCCDGCLQVLEWEDDAIWHHTTAREAAESAQASGWLITDRTQLCQACAEARVEHGQPSELTRWLGADGLPPAPQPIHGEGLAGFGC
ncbi:hypothetical protein [Microlunatus ginsengisoli]|uniref:Uncharacterized protein n=1 Tax=Microlunatus ginsengisoli TaxID=363863 RepID=A0ABP6ZNV5_9ACTN